MHASDSPIMDAAWAWVEANPDDPQAVAFRQAFADLKAAAEELEGL